MTSIEDAVSSIMDNYMLRPLEFGGRTSIYLREEPQEVRLPGPQNSRGKRVIKFALLAKYAGANILFEMPVSGLAINRWLQLTEIQNNVLILELTTEQVPTAEEITDIKNQWSDGLSEGVDRINNLLEPIRVAIRSKVTEAVTERFGQLRGLAQLNATLNIPIHNASVQIPIPVQRQEIRIIEKPVSAQESPEYQLEEVIYRDIIRTITMMSRSMERTPRTFDALHEEDLRNLYLAVLNANYEGAAAGEVFNGSGKTDILLRWLNLNAFIGECKFWDGPSKFSEAIDQLLGYLVWRDSKAALVIFIKQVDASGVVEKARQAVKDHSSFISEEASDEYGNHHYVIRSKSDSDKMVHLTLICVVLAPSDAS